MNAHAIVSCEYRFAIGALVTHCDQPMLSVVTGRVRTTKGREIYGIRRIEECAVRDLMILGDVLVAG